MVSAETIFITIEIDISLMYGLQHGVLEVRLTSTSVEVSEKPVSRKIHENYNTCTRKVYSTRYSTLYTQ